VLSQALRNGRSIYGTLIGSTSPKWISAVKGVGLDFVFIDNEHTPIDQATLAWMCEAYTGIGTPAVVRIPSIDPNEARKALDSGAAGVIAPYVETANQVRDLVGAVKLRPLKGEQLLEILANPQSLQPELRNYLEEFNRGKVLIVNIESVPAMENLDEILSVEGLDAILIGPHDLSVSLDIPEQYAEPLFDQAVRSIITKARARNIGAGIHFSGDIDLEIGWVKAGANLILHNGDLNLFRRALLQDLQKIREALGEAEAKFEPDQRVII